IIEGPRTCTATQKVQDLLSGECHTDNRPSAPIVTTGIQLPAPESKEDHISKT
ncbi:hypothetical protein BT96DRAFT_764240, partial [Gymnopus androsaceus JB14]